MLEAEDFYRWRTGPAPTDGCIVDVVLPDGVIETVWWWAEAGAWYIHLEGDERSHRLDVKEFICWSYA